MSVMSMPPASETDPTAPDAAPPAASGAPAGTDWRDDPFFVAYFRRIDPRVADSFTPEQRAALKLMFAGRAPGRHWLDMRRSLPWFGHRVYVVLLMGRERRTLERLRREGMIGRGASGLMLGLWLCIALGPVLAALYLVKTWVGIDVFPDGGVHATYDMLVRHIEMTFGQ